MWICHAPPPNKLRRAIWTFGALTLSGLVTITFVLRRDNPGVPPEPIQIPQNPLSISTAELEIGTVFETRSRDHVVHIANTSSHVILIERFEASCDCVGIKPEKNIELQPGEKKPFTFKLALTANGSLSRSIGEPRQVQFSAVYKENGKQVFSQPWTLNCNVIPTIRFNRTLYFDRKSNRESQIEQSLDIHATDDVHAIEFASSRDWSIEIQNSKATQLPGKMFIAVIRSRGELQNREINDRILLTPIGRDSRPLPPKELTVVGKIDDDVVGVPEDIAFGRVLIGSTRTESVCLRSLTGRQFQVKRYFADNSSFIVTPISGPDSNFAVSTRFESVGEQSAKVEFLVQDDNGKEFRVAIPVRYHGAREF